MSTKPHPSTAGVALVTGASRGIGRAIALRLARDGASVVDLIRSSGGRAISVRADVGDFNQTDSMIERVRAELGAIDILINNAGIVRMGDLMDFDYSQMDVMRRTNVDGLVHLTRAVV